MTGTLYTHRESGSRDAEEPFVPTENDDEPLRSLLPASAELPARLQALNQSPAPFAWPGGSWLRRQAKRLAMLPLRILGRNQREFNEGVRDSVTLLAAEVGGMRQFLEERVRFLDGPHAFEARIAAVERGLGHLQSHFASLAGALRERHDALVTSVTRVEAAYAEVGARDGRLAAALEQQRLGASEQRQELRDLATRVAALGDVSPWVTLLQRRMEAMALEMRELQARSTEVPAPRFVDGEAYRRRVGTMGGELRVNLGCGERPWPDYVNVDLRELPDVDIVADARRLPFEPGTLTELSSSHLVEHFREYQFRTRVLPYWKSLLRPRGRLRIICPNWQAMLDRLRDGRMAYEHFKQVTFGAQDYEGDDHYSMYTPQTLERLLLDAGFVRMEIITAERMNGLCPEMEVVAHMPPG